MGRDVACMDEMRDLYILVGNHEGRRPLWRTKNRFLRERLTKVSERKREVRYK
jgi:hypothetical protein